MCWRSWISKEIKDYLNENFHILINHLQKIYGNDYIITHYIGAQYPVCKVLVEEIPLANFYEPDIAKQVTGTCTFYIPPNILKDIDPFMPIHLGTMLKRRMQENMSRISKI